MTETKAHELELTDRGEKDQPAPANGVEESVNASKAQEATEQPSSQAHNADNEEGEDDGQFRDTKIKGSSATENTSQQTEKLQPRVGFLIGYALCFGLGAFQTGWTISGNAATAPVLIVKFGWDEEQAKFYNSMLNLSAILGLVVGSFAASKLIALGRNKAAMIVQAGALIGCLLTLVRTVPTICVGRFLIGFAGGTCNIAMGKALDETVPPSLIGYFGIQTNALITFAIMSVMLMGAMLPEDEADYMDDQNWRIIFAMPGVFAVAQILLLLTVFRQEPIIYCIANGKDSEALELIKRVYKPIKQEDSNNDSVYDGFFAVQKKNTSSDASSISFSAAVCGKRYGRGTWILFFLNVFNQASGINAINIYATRLLLNLQDSTDGQFPVTPRMGTYLIGVSNFFFALLAFFPVTYLGRKTIFLLGQFSMGICLAAVGLCIVQEYYLLSYSLLVAFIASFQLSTGSSCWIYNAEIAVDQASGVIMMGQFLVLLLFSVTMEYMMSGWLQAHGTFWLFSICCIIGGFFVIGLVKETRGLTDRQKKTLYASKSIASVDIL